jgi:hypothetical protein
MAKKKKLPPGVKRSLQRRVASPKQLSKEERRRKSELKSVGPITPSDEPG